MESSSRLRDFLGIDIAVNDWVRPFPRARTGIDDGLKLGALRRLAGEEDVGDLRSDEPTPEDGYFAWGWSGSRDFGYPSEWAKVSLVGGPSVFEQLDRRLGSLRLPAATLAGAGLFTLAAAIVIRTRDRRRSRALLRRIAELEIAGERALAGAVIDTPAPDAAEDEPGASAMPVDTGQVPVTTELSGKIDTVRRMVRREEPVPGDLTTRAIARIYQDLDQGLNPSDLADSLFVSLRTLQRAVSGSLGCSPSELIMAVRLYRSCAPCTWRCDGFCRRRARVHIPCRPRILCHRPELLLL